MTETIAEESTRLSVAWWVYMILADDGSLYTGISTDVERRFQQHLERRGGARYFHARKPVRVVWREPQADRAQASRREAAIKRLSRNAKLALIQDHPAAGQLPDKSP